MLIKSTSIMQTRKWLAAREEDGTYMHVPVIMKMVSVKKIVS